MMKKKLIAALLAATVAAGTMPSAGALLDGFTASRTYSNQFADVPTNAWYYDSVKSAYNLGLVNGSSATTYSPNKEVTIAELYAMASRIHATYYGNEIQPVDGAWFAPYVEYSQEYLDTGSHDTAYSYSDGSLVANLPATRWYFACILYAAVDPSEFNQLNHVLSGSIEDIDAMENEEVRDCIYTLYNAGILTGSDAYGTFHPDDGITRAEVATIMARIIDPSQRKTFTLKDKPVTVSLANYVGEWYFNDWPNSGLEIIKNGNDYYLSLGIVQGMGYRTNGTLDPVKLVSKGTYYESLRFDTRGGATAIAKIRPEGNQLVVSCTEYGTSSLSLNMSGRSCSRR